MQWNRGWNIRFDSSKANLPSQFSNEYHFHRAGSLRQSTSSHPLPLPSIYTAHWDLLLLYFIYILNLFHKMFICLRSGCYFAQVKWLAPSSVWVCFWNRELGWHTLLLFDKTKTYWSELCDTEGNCNSEFANICIYLRINAYDDGEEQKPMSKYLT